MVRYKWVLLGLLLCIFGVELAQAHDYIADVDRSVWFVEPSPLMCRLRHPVPQYGEAVFEVPAGEKMQFYMGSKRAVEVVEPVTFESWAPAWRHDVAPHQLGMVQGGVGNQPVRVGAELASVLLDELQEGLFPVVTHRGWHAGHRVQIAVSSVNFPESYEAFQDCISNLFPISFAQIERSTVLFEVDKSVVAEEYMSHLRLIAQYMAIDPSVRVVILDGHTDSTGRQGYNWDLSRRRSEAVRAVLTKMGITEDQIVLRYHGETLPIATNRSKSGRSRNRRVTLRLERDEM